MSGFARLYTGIYERLAGRAPAVHPWHFQWLAVRYLYNDLQTLLPTLHGRVLDVGCGDKPYGVWLDRSRVTEHLGIDVYPGPRVDLVIEPGRPWALETASFDALVCTQVLEHVADLEHVLSEMRRVLKPGGTLIASVPFAYHQHAFPDDYRRLSVNGAVRLFQDDYDLIEVRPQGGIGSTLAVYWLNWIDVYSSAHRAMRFAKAALLPGWLAASGLVNGLGAALDRVDDTRAFYGNTLVVARRKG
jgi:SAM-dependent methyltransferase